MIALALGEHAHGRRRAGVAHRAPTRCGSGCGGCGRWRWPGRAGRPTHSRRWREVRTVLDEELGLEPCAGAARARRPRCCVRTARRGLAPGAARRRPTAAPASGAGPPWTRCVPAAALAAGGSRRGARPGSSAAGPGGGRRPDVRRAHRRAGHRQDPAVRGAAGRALSAAGPGAASAAAPRTTAHRRCGRGSRCCAGSGRSSTPRPARTRARSSVTWESIVARVAEAARGRAAGARARRPALGRPAEPPGAAPAGRAPSTLGRLLVLATWRSPPRADRRAGRRRRGAGPSARRAARADGARPGATPPRWSVPWPSVAADRRAGRRAGRPHRRQPVLPRRVRPAGARRR